MKELLEKKLIPLSSPLLTLPPHYLLPPTSSRVFSQV